MALEKKRCTKVHQKCDGCQIMYMDCFQNMVIGRKQQNIEYNKLLKKVNDLKKVIEMLTEKNEALQKERDNYQSIVKCPPKKKPSITLRILAELMQCSQSETTIETFSVDEIARKCLIEPQLAQHILDDLEKNLDFIRKEPSLLGFNRYYFKKD